MSSNILFKTPGRTTNYMPIGLNVTKGEILEKYARSSFSSANDWPNDSPSAGFYDIKNSDTKLILLNEKKTYSHLRGKTKAKHQSFKKDPHYDWVEKEIERKKNSSTESLNRDGGSSSRLIPNPERHLIKTGCSYRCKPDETEVGKPSEEYFNLRERNKSAVPVSSGRCLTASLDKKQEERLENDILLQYLYEVGKRTTGLQGTVENKRPPREFLASYNINHPQFSKGQRLFINELCGMYSVTPLKQSKQDQYIKLFKNQADADQKHRHKYRMHGGDNFDLYKKWLVAERPLPQQVNCGYYHPMTANYRQSSLKCKSMITKHVSSPSFSNGSTFVSNSSIEKVTKPKHEQTVIQRPKTAKEKTNTFSPIPMAKTEKSKTELVSSSDDEPKPSNRIESTDLIKNIKEVTAVD